MKIKQNENDGLLGKSCYRKSYEATSISVRSTYFRSQGERKWRIEIESNNMSKDLAATTNETSLTTTPNNSAQDRNTETN